MVTMSISGQLIADVRNAWALSVDYANTGIGVRHGQNAYTPHAYSAYVSAVASVEAFLNETFLSPKCRQLFRKSPLWDLGDATRERMDLLSKIIIVPQLLFGCTLKRGEQPFQDFDLLHKVRNDIVHFKMQSTPPKYIKDLTQRAIALPGNPEADYPWPTKICSTEGIRWAHNAACGIVGHLVSLVPQDKRERLVAFASHNFREIELPEAYAKLTLTEPQGKG